MARGAGHCRRCHFRSVALSLNADPAFKAAKADRLKALHADPAFEAAIAAGRRALQADKIKSLALSEHEVSEWRAIRAKGFASAEAAGVVIRSRKACVA